MRIPIIEFEHHIEKPVLRRGRAYFKKGHVERCEEIDEGEYEAVVVGTQDYTVEISIHDGFITEYLCECPYDTGPVCKHLVAVVFHLLQNQLGLEKQSSKPRSARTPAKRKTVAERVSDLLNEVSHDELKQFIQGAAEHDRSFRAMFLSSFAHRGGGESKAFYVAQIKSILRAASGRQGFIDWRSVSQVGTEVYRLLDIAQKQLEAENYLSSVHICTAVLEQMTEAIQYADDSNADIGGNANFASEILHEIAGLAIPESVREYLLDYCLTAFDKKIFNGWDWHLDMLRISSLLIKTEEEAQLLFTRTKRTGRSDFEREELESITYRTLLKVRGEKEAEEYLEQHITNSDLRREAIKKAIGSKQYEKARSLAMDGVGNDQKDKPGLALEWYDWLLKIAQAEKDIEGIVDYARLLFVDGFRHEQDYYALLKHHISPDKWADFLEGLIRDVSARSRWGATGQIANIYIAEKWWPRLLELVKESPTLQTLETYEQYLKKDFADDLAAMYADAVLKFAKDNVGRPHYKTACKYIRRIKKLGAPQKAEEIIRTLRTEYPQRRALLEELELI